MTDARAARVAEKALVSPIPSAQVAKDAAKALVAPVPSAVIARQALKVLLVQHPPAQVSRVHVETLLRPVPRVQMSRVHVETLLRPVPSAQLSRAHVEALLTYRGADTYDQAVLDLSPIANFMLDETTGTVANTTPPSGWTGTYANAPTLGVPGRVSGTAVQVALTGNKVLQITPPSGCLSVSFWYKYVTTGGSTTSIVGNTGGLSTNRSSLHYANTGNADLVVRLLGDAGALTYTGLGTTLTDLGWHHLTLVSVPATNTVLYIDGLSAATHPNTNDILAAFNLMRFCQRPTGETSNGVIDQVSFFYNPLTAPQVATLYAAAPPLVTSLSGEWVMYG